MPQRDRLDFLTEGWNVLRPEMDITPWGIWGRTTRIHEIFLNAISRVLGRHELNFKEFQTIGALVLAGPPYQASPSELTKFNLLTSGGVANLLLRMEKERLIERRPHPDDKRAVVVQLTNHGHAAFDSAVVEENAVEHEMLQGLTPEEREILAVLLRKLLLSIDPVSVAR